jgi:hypothetical protein
MNTIKKIYDWIVNTLLWDLSHNVKWDLFFHITMIILQIITVILLYRMLK